MKKQIFKMKILRNSLIFCLMLFFSHVSIASSQVVKVSVNLNNVTINEIIDHVSQKINYRFFLTSSLQKPLFYNYLINRIL